MSKKINITIDKVYTKKGDKGSTDIIGEKNILKSDLRIICYGEADELNSSIGFSYALIKECDALKNDKILDSIKMIQNDLFNLGTMLAISDTVDAKDYPTISSENIKLLENLIDTYNKDLPSLKSFVLPSGSRIGAYFHVCRTICRRVERSCVSLSQNSKVDSNIIIYINRLSDLLFVWARWTNKKLGSVENFWSI